MADDDDGDNVISITDGRPSDRTYEKTLIDNGRRYTSAACLHKGPFIFDRKLATVECQDCGALLNPLYVLEVLANREAYWNRRAKDLAAYLAEVNKELAERTRTKCTHCGNMTPIRLKKEMPKTWVPQPY